MKQISSMSWLTSISIMVVLLFLTLFLFITYHSGVIIDQAKNSSKILIELDKDISDSLKIDIITSIKSFEGVELNSINEYDEQEALSLMKEEMADLSFSLDSNPFSTILSFTLRSDFHNTDYYEKIQNELVEKQGVNIVNIQEIDFAELNNNLKKSTNVLCALFGLLASFTLILLFNMTRISLMKDEKKIRTMRLVGAQERFIMIPYLKRSLFMGLTAFMGCVMITIVTVLIANQIDGFYSTFIVPSYVYQIFIIVLLLALILPMISTYMIIRLYLRKL